MKVIVTGHSKGLGAAIAGNLLVRGVTVLGLARDRNDALAARYPDTLRQAALDLADGAALAQWLDNGELRDFLCGEDAVVLINNAGTVQPVALLNAQDGAAVARAIALNVGAPLVLAAAFAFATKAAKDRRIAHISSGAGRSAYPGWSVYCAGKAALDHHARAVALEENGALRICSLAPGIVDTGMQAEIRAASDSDFPLKQRFEALKRDGQLATPEATAQQLVDYVLGDAFGSAPVADVRELA